MGVLIDVAKMMKSNTFPNDSAILIPLGLNFLCTFCAHFLINLEMSESQRDQGGTFRDPAYSVMPVLPPASSDSLMCGEEFLRHVWSQ